MPSTTSRCRDPRPALLLASLSALAPLAAQEPLPPAAIGPGTALARVHVDAPGDGNVWVLAPGYKVRFGADAVQFFPYLGAKTERLFPVTFHTRGASLGERALPLRPDTAPTVDGMRVVYERGGVREVWELRQHEVEQTFVVSDLDGSGDLVVRIDVETDLRGEDDAAGLRFAHGTRGCVQYGDVLTVDAAGRRQASPARLCEGGIELRVPAVFVASATSPLTIDPVVRAITVDGGSDLVGNADVAFEPTTKNWLVAYVRQFATTDSDIVTRRFNSAGDLLEEVVVATGSRESGNPSVGANGPARQFLVAWDEDTSVADRVILGRTRDAGSTAQGSTFTVLDTSGVGRDDIAPSVGGSIATDANGATYAVFCLSDNSVGRHVSFVRVTTAGGVSLRGVVSTSGQDVVDVKATKARTTDGTWLCAYLRNAAGVRHVHIADAPVTGTTFRSARVDDSADCRLGGIAGRAPHYLVLFAKLVGTGNSDIFSRRVQITASSLILGATVDLTAIEPGAVVARDQTNPTLTFDGCRYTYAYQEAAGAAGSFDLYAAVISQPPIVFTDGHRALHTASSDREENPTIASSGEMGGDLARSLVVFDRNTGNDLDVAGVLFDGFAFAGGVTTLPTGCGPLQLVAQNEPILGTTLRLRASRLRLDAQLFLLGGASAPITLCARGCALGVNPIVATVLGASLDLPIPCTASVVGAEIAVQNIQVGGTAGCQPPDTPVALETSPTLVIRVR